MQLLPLRAAAKHAKHAGRKALELLMECCSFLNAGGGSGRGSPPSGGPASTAPFGPNLDLTRLKKK